jgi:hypothetical protein
VPAPHTLYLNGRLPANTYIVGFPYDALSRDELLAHDDHVWRRPSRAHLHK